MIGFPLNRCGGMECEIIGFPLNRRGEMGWENDWPTAQLVAAKWDSE
jgi:hypothetical protein